VIEGHVRELHYVVKYNMETKVWEIDWDSIEARFVDGNYYDSRNGWDLLEPEFEDTIIQELNTKLIGDKK
jgi:hypothetical protein